MGLDVAGPGKAPNDVAIAGERSIGQPMMVWHGNRLAFGRKYIKIVSLLHAEWNGNKRNAKQAMLVTPQLHPSPDGLCTRLHTLSL